MYALLVQHFILLLYSLVQISSGNRSHAELSAVWVKGPQQCSQSVESEHADTALGTTGDVVPKMPNRTVCVKEAAKVQSRERASFSGS